MTLPPCLLRMLLPRSQWHDQWIGRLASSVGTPGQIQQVSDDKDSQKEPKQLYSLSPRVKRNGVPTDFGLLWAFDWPRIEQSRTIPYNTPMHSDSAAAPVNVGLVQMTCGDDPGANLAKATQRIEEAARRGAQIVCLQELFSSPYFCQREDTNSFQLAESIPGPTTETLSRVAAIHQLVLIVPLFEKRAAGLFHNTVVVIDTDGSLVGKYRKMHIPDDPLYYEKFYFTPGDLGFRTFDTQYARIGVLICWDQWFPEAARLTALSGAQLLFYPTAIGWQHAEPSDERDAQRQAWETIQRGHAVANGVYVAAVNRVGTEAGLQFWGSSFMSDPFGRVLARAGTQDEETLVMACDLGRIDTVRQDWPFLRDRRIDAYTNITRRYLD